MKSTTTLIILGILIALLPFSGLPGLWRNILCIIFGLSVSSIVFYHVRKARASQDNKIVETEDDEVTSDNEQ